MPNKVRIDKWLWSIRIFKTRSLSTDACKSGRVKVNGKSVKPSFHVEEAMEVTINSKEKKWIVIALKLIEKRISSSIAQTCYEDKSPVEETSSQLTPSFYITSEARDRGTGRPTKKERRTIDLFKEIKKE